MTCSPRARATGCPGGPWTAQRCMRSSPRPARSPGGRAPGGGGRRPATGKALAQTGAEVDRALVAAVADALCCKSVFTRYELLRMVNRHLPGYLGGCSGARVRALLEELTSRALAPGGACGIVRLTAPDMVPVPAAFRRADGLSLWRTHSAEVYNTRRQLDVETRLLRAA